MYDDETDFSGLSNGSGGLFDLNFGNSNSTNNFNTQGWNDLGGDYTNSGLYQNTPNYNSNNNQDTNNFLGSSPQDTFNNFNNYQSASSFGGGLQDMFKLSPGTYAAAQLPTQNTEENDRGLSGMKDYLSKILDNKGLMSLVGSLFEGQQNKKQASSIQNIVAQQQAQQEAQRQLMMQRQDQQQKVVSPYDVPSVAVGGDTMRNNMQQQLINAMKDPYGQPIVKAQTDALMQAQARKDAAAGRRSNMATSMPALLASQASIAQNYIDKLQGPAGAQINPNYPSLNNNVGNTDSQLLALLKASQYNNNGYLSPLFNALGFNATQGK